MRIAILDDYQHVALELADWASLAAEIEVFHEPLGDLDTAARRLRGFDVIVAMRERTPFPGELLRQLTGLRLLVTTGRANRSIDLAMAEELGIRVSCTRGGSTTIELTWALILTAVRNLPSEMASVRRGGWQTTVGGDLHGRTLGLLGLGKLGTRTAEVGQAFGMRTIAWSPNLTTERAAEHGIEAVSKRELFVQSDVVSIHLVLGESTRGVVGADELGSMKSSALLVNTSRGPLVDEQALLACLRARTIRGAALDVFDQEPLPVNHPLRYLDNAFVTPHLGYVTADTYETFYRDAVEDIDAWAQGTPIRVLA
jgi:phosphoglycerate dehydrogenase-like enzyme